MTALRTWDVPRPAALRSVGGAGNGASFTVVVSFLAAHVVLGLVASQISMVALAQGVATLLVGVGFALASQRLDRIFAIAAYAAMCDVFWRMTKSGMPWEGGKYSAMVILLIAFFRFAKRPKRIGLPVAFVALLLPACAMTVVVLPLGEARDLIASNLAGPFLLALSVATFRQAIATEHEVTTILWVMLGPIVAVCTIATRSTAALGADAFGTNSNFGAAGGFGPNQVSMLLGLGALICVVWLLQRVTLRLLLLQVALSAWFVGQAALTFSRGGLYGAAGGVAAIVVVALGTSGMRSRVTMGLAIGAVIAVVAFPYLNSFTNGSLEQRYADTDTTNRADIANSDVDLFEREPMFGVGVGVAKYERQTTETGFAVESKAHTEYTRMLGEHGMFGLIALIILLVMAVQAVRSAAGRWNRLYAAALGMWALISMSHSATSIAAIGFVFGLAHLRSNRTGTARRAVPAPRPLGAVALPRP